MRFLPGGIIIILGFLTLLSGLVFGLRRDSVTQGPMGTTVIAIFTCAGGAMALGALMIAWQLGLRQSLAEMF